jgi:hypothetical protein
MNAKKILAIFMCMLMITLIPVAAGAAEKQTKDPQPADIGVTHIRGIITEPSFTYGMKYITFRCVWVHYTTRGLGEHSSGTLHLLQKLTLKNDFQGVFFGKHMFKFIMGSFPGELELN